MAGVDVWVFAHHWSVDERFTYHLQVSKKQTNKHHKNKVVNIVNLITIINFLLITRQIVYPSVLRQISDVPSCQDWLMLSPYARGGVPFPGRSRVAKVKCIAVLLEFWNVCFLRSLGLQPEILQVVE